VTSAMARGARPAASLLNLSFGEKEELKHMAANEKKCDFCGKTPMKVRGGRTTKVLIGYCERCEKYCCTFCAHKAAKEAGLARGKWEMLCPSCGITKWT